MIPKACRVDLDPEIAAEIRRRIGYEMSQNPHDTPLTLPQAVNLILRHVLSEDPSDTLLVVRMPAARKNHPLRGAGHPIPPSGLHDDLQGHREISNESKRLRNY